MKVDRLVSIIMTLLDKERIGAQELADTFEVSPLPTQGLKSMQI